MNVDGPVVEFINSVNGRGKGFHNQAVELIKACRAVYTVLEESPDQNHLQGVLQRCDVVLKDAANGIKKSKLRGEIEQKIKMAARDLGDCVDSAGTYVDNVEDATNRDRRDNRLGSNPKRIIRKKTQNNSFWVVRFQILHPGDPIIIKQAIISSELADIVWNSKLAYADNDRKLLSVAQHPRFHLTHPTNGADQHVAELIWPYPTDTVYIRCQHIQVPTA